MPNPARRSLAFASLDEVMPDVDRLLQGHTTVGNWSLGQICNHLAGAITCTLDGFPVLMPWLLRRTVGPLVMRRIITTGRMPEGVRVPRKYLPRPGLDARAEAESLRAALARFAVHTGPVAEHPLGGRICYADWHRFHAAHCAHHLSFARPR